MSAASLTRSRFRSQRTAQFTESVIREMTRWANRVGAVSLAQGFPDFPAPDFLKQAAIDAICSEYNQYSVTWGAKPLRDAIARKYSRWYGLDYDPEREVTVCCGATEGMIASLLAVTNPGDEIVVFEPFYENYRPDTLLCDAITRLVPLHSPDWTFDPEELRRAFNSRTKAIILNSPNNPTGRVFTREELLQIAELVREFDTLVITDEIYEHILYDGSVHTPMASMPEMRDRTILVNSMSKTWSVTGWRVGWILASPDLTDVIRKVHDFLTVGAAHPLQMAGAAALDLPDEYYAGLSAEYSYRRDLLLSLLEKAGFPAYRPQGAYYILSDISSFGFPDDVAFARHLIERAGVAVVPGSSFFSQGGRGNQIVRFCFCKKEETLREAGERLLRLEVKSC
ncbi:MAG: aminotransferase class I/II-fold pyridoxal phosphate-dependent enzyme [Bryobacteraceae bacterium]|nr:aminotransferase class I/II-fold pyridoxal phosphate-dependent enzyme [Bryobacteraceae bacterium]